MDEFKQLKWLTSVQDEVAESKKADGDFLTCRHWEAFFFVAACTGVNCDEGMFLLSASDVTLKYQSLWIFKFALQGTTF
jgi:hypothetical protein